MTKRKFVLPLLKLWVRFRRLGEKNTTLILSFVVGLISGLAGVLLKNTLHHFRNLIAGVVPMDSTNALYFGLPAIGILFTILFVRYIVNDDLSHGVTKVLYSISRQGSRIKPHNMISSIIGSILTIGFGGSVGAEAPIAYSGSAIGSNIGKFFRLNYQTRTLLIGCGAAGAIASIFKAPIAGIIFTLEVLMLDLTTASIVPLLISAVTASTVSYFLMGRNVVFAYEVVRPFTLHNIPWFILLGIFSGFVSLYFIRTTFTVERLFKKTRSPYKRWFFGSLVLGILIFIFPPLFGEGYDVLQALLDGRSSYIFHNSPLFQFQDNIWLILTSLFFLVAFKAIASSITNGAGGVGGIFAPALFIGGVSGFFLARILNLFDFINISESNFALVGMAGAMAGIMHAPFMAIFLIAEITGGYALFIPLMITSTIAFLTIMYFEPHSVYTKRLAQRGELITHHKDKAVLTLLSVKKVIERDFIPVRPTETLGNLVKKVSQSKRNIFPVITDDFKFVGVVSLDDIRPVMFDTSQYDAIKVQELMNIPPEIININDHMEDVMKKFEYTKAWNLPVVDGGKYVGFVSKSKIFSVYRNLLIQFSKE
ncbi:MAG: chloride channel protein family [Tenuifilum sp.]|jgi:CIC family chloride channel protein|uniref:chloride channel protein n=1 Tax=Tenuifilum sp. TaxID=2760880 RepID=UPI0024AA3BDE|nr:chloride channel protein [Tenuifilum sp.]MDI3527667.1 chloride channel protein family [Tenuifilum sp.]